MLIDKSAMLLLIVILFTSINSIFSAIYTCDPRNSCGCSAVSTTVTARIVGGEAAENYAWNWMISFQLLGEHRCGASLLTPEYAVTAAHCVNGIMGNLSILSILTGTNYLDDTTSPSIQRRAITKIAMNPYYVASSEINDIAILQFAPLNTSSDYEIAFICLPQQDQDPFQTNSNLVVIGWGVTSESSETVSNYLQQVTVQAFSPTSTDCEQSGIVNTTVQFCAGIEGGGKGKFLLLKCNLIKTVFYLLQMHVKVIVVVL
jgi:secreted trypsin-like serine protease